MAVTWSSQQTWGQDSSVGWGLVQSPEKELRDPAPEPVARSGDPQSVARWQENSGGGLVHANPDPGTQGHGQYLCKLQECAGEMKSTASFTKAMTQNNQHHEK